MQQINQHLFAGCTNLTTIVIKSTTIPALLHSNAFIETSSQFAIFVPDSLVSAYRSNGGWSVLGNVIKSINELTEVL